MSKLIDLDLELDYILSNYAVGMDKAVNTRDGEAGVQAHNVAKQAILQKLQEEYKRGYIDGGISQLTKQEEQ